MGKPRCHAGSAVQQIRQALDSCLVDPAPSDCAMARPLRMEFAGACYHVIKRGNYRQGLFADEGAAEAFIRCWTRRPRRSGWRVHAYLVIRNPFHLEFFGTAHVEFALRGSFADRSARRGRAPATAPPKGLRVARVRSRTRVRRSVCCHSPADQVAGAFPRERPRRSRTSRSSFLAMPHPQNPTPTKRCSPPR